MIPNSLAQHQQTLIQVAKDNDVSYLAFFGSYARGEQKSDSDVDMLVSFDPNRKKGLLEFIGLEQKFSQILGVKVDLVTKQALSKYIKPYIQDDLQVIYAKKS